MGGEENGVAGEWVGEENGGGGEWGGDQYSPGGGEVCLAVVGAA